MKNGDIHAVNAASASVPDDDMMELRRPTGDIETDLDPSDPLAARQRAARRGAPKRSDGRGSMSRPSAYLSANEWCRFGIRLALAVLTLPVFPTASTSPIRIIRTMSGLLDTRLLYIEAKEMLFSGPWLSMVRNYGMAV